MITIYHHVYYLTRIRDLSAAAGILNKILISLKTTSCKAIKTGILFVLYILRNNKEVCHVGQTEYLPGSTGVLRAAVCGQRINILRNVK
jgi:hypothetical protein